MFSITLHVVLLCLAIYTCIILHACDFCEVPVNTLQFYPLKYNQNLTAHSSWTLLCCSCHSCITHYIVLPNWIPIQIGSSVNALATHVLYPSWLSTSGCDSCTGLGTMTLYRRWEDCKGILWKNVMSTSRTSSQI